MPSSLDAVGIEVPEVLVDPVRHQPADDVLAATTARRGCRRPTLARCSSRRSCRGRRRSWSTARPTAATARRPASTPRGTASGTPRSRRRRRRAPPRDVGRRRSLRSCAVPSATGRRRRPDRRGRRSRCGHSLGCWPSIRRPWARSASTPRWRGSRPGSRSCGGWCGAAARQLPNRTRSGPSPPSVRIVLSGNGEPAIGHADAPSSSTRYGVVDPGSRSSITTRA